MSKKNKLNKILEVLTTSDDTADDSFAKFDEGVAKLKFDLKEGITVKTIDEVNSRLSNFTNEWGNKFKPLEDAVGGLRSDFETKKAELDNLLQTKSLELSNLLETNTSLTGNEIQKIATELRDEIQGIHTALAELSKPKEDKTPSIEKSIVDLEDKVFKTIKEETNKVSAQNQLSSEETKKTFDSQKTEILSEIEKVRTELTQRLNIRGGNMNRQIRVEGVDVLTKFTDINFYGVTSSVISSVDNDNKRVNIGIQGGGGSGSPGGNNTEIQYNNGGAFGGVPILTYNNNSSVLSVTNFQLTNVQPKVYVTVGDADADYITSDYASDDLAVQAALDSLPSTGGEVFCKSATYTFNAPVVINKSNIKLTGNGWSTVFKAKVALNDNVFEFDNTSFISNCIFQDFKIDGSRLDNTSGNGIDALGATVCVFQRLWITSVSDYFLHFNGRADNAFGSNNQIIGCHFTVGGQNTSRGIYIQRCDESKIIGCLFSGLKGYHIYDNSGTATITGNVFVGGAGVTSGVGIYVLNTANTIISSNEFDSLNDEFIYLDNSDDCIIIGNQMSKTAGNSAALIRLSSADATVINGNRAQGGSNYTYAIQELSGCTNTMYGINSLEAGTSGTILQTGRPGASFVSPLEAQVQAVSSVAQIAITQKATSGNGAALSYIEVNPGSSGDPYTHYSIDGVEDFVSGIDNSDGDKFKISDGVSLGTLDVVTIDPAAGRKLRLGMTGSVVGAVEFVGGTSGTTVIQPASVAGNWTLTLPTTDGNNGEYLFTDGNGITQWGSVTGAIRRSTSILSVSSTLAASTNTDYVFFANVGVALTLPTAVGNTNRYTIKNYSASSVLLVSNQGIDDGATALLGNTYQAVDLVSNNSVWGVI